jgi:cell division inhibitor SulA
LDCRIHNAAPDLLLAAHNYVNAIDSIVRDFKAGHKNVAIGSLENLADMARAAIAKAEGMVSMSAEEILEGDKF